MDKITTARKWYRNNRTCRSNIPVEIILGNSAPEMRGESSHYVTMGGTRIQHPNAYSRKGRSNMRYVPSTLCLVVGEDWKPEA